MKKSSKHIRSASNHSVRNRSVFVPLSAGFCATALAITGGVVANASAASSVAASSSVAKLSAKLTTAATAKKANSVTGGGVQSSEAGAVPTVPATKISQEQAKNMPGCEAEIKDENGVKYLVIKPKNNANEGIISADLKPEEFEAIRDKLKSNNMYGVTLKFEGRVYGYGSIAGLFSEIRIDSLGNIGDFDVSNVTDMSYVFGRYRDLKSLDGLGRWNTSNVTNMNSMFYKSFSDDFISEQSSSSFLDPIANWDVSKVTNMDSMFYWGTNLKNIDALGKWDTSNVKNMSYMFSNCKKLKNLDGLKNWKTSNVTDMSYMFEDCKSLLNINGVAKWNTGNVTNMQRMFANCLQSVNVCDNSKGNCLLSHSFVSSVPDLDAVKNWDVSKVSKMGGMFAGSYTLTDISALKNWQFNKDLPYIDLGYLVTGNRINEDNYVDFLKSLIQNLKGFQGVLELDGLGLEKLNESQIKEIFGNPYDSIIIIYEKFDENIDANSALLKLKTKKQVTLTFTGSKKHSIEINDFPAVYISSEAWYNDGQQRENDIAAVSSVVNKAIESKIKELQKTYPELTGNYSASKKISNANDVFQTYKLAVDKSRIKNPEPEPTPTPQPPTPEPEPEPTPTPDPTLNPNPTPGGDTPGGGLNPDGGGSGDKPGNNPNNNPGNGSNNGDNTNGSGAGNGGDNTKNDNTNNNGNRNGDAGNGGNNTNGSNTNRNRNGGSAGGNGLNAGGNGSNSSNSAKSNASDSAKDSSKNHSDSSDSAKDSTKDSAKDSAKDSKDSAKSSASSSAKRASKSSNFGLIASIIGALAAFAAIVGGFFFFILFGKKRKKRKDEDENEGEN